jgi:hypothetical protein
MLLARRRILEVGSKKKMLKRPRLTESADVHDLSFAQPGMVKDWFHARNHQLLDANRG